MYTVIFASNIKQATFLQKGFACENLPSEIIAPDAVQQLLERKLYQADGIFLLLEAGTVFAEFIDKCRLIHPGIPVIILASQFEPSFNDLYQSGKISAYFIRPFPFRQITAEMKYLIFSRREKTEPEKYTVRDLELDIQSHQLRINSNPVYLRNKEFSLLHYMVANKGKVVTRPEILEHVWDRNADVLTNTVDVHVSQLRKKIRKNTGDVFIHTVPCMGYIVE